MIDVNAAKMKEITNLTYDEWFERFEPIENHLSESAPFDGHMFETYGEEIVYIKSTPDKYVWTVVDIEGDLYIMNGYHYVNRVGYMRTHHPFTEADGEIEVIVNS